MTVTTNPPERAAPPGQAAPPGGGSMTVDRFVRSEPSRPDYEFDVDPGDWNNTVTRQLALVPGGARVLEVGSAGGLVTAELTARGAEVVAVEIDPRRVAAARAAGRPSLCLDLLAADGPAQLRSSAGPALFDVVLFGDVLEHIADPVDMLCAVRPLLRPSGVVIASIPNVAFGGLRIRHLVGQFAYADAGLLDRTHLHLFDRREIGAVFASAGFTVEEIHHCYAEIFGWADGAPRGLVPPDVEALVSSHLDSWVYQYVVVASPVGLDWAAGASPTAPPRQRAALVVAELGPDGPGAPVWARVLPAGATHVRVEQLGGEPELAGFVSSLDPATPVLVVTPDIVPERSWLQALWSATGHHGRPVGLRLADRNGSLLHAGMTADGSPAFAGLWVDHPVARTERTTLLGPPYLARAGDLAAGGPVRGRLVVDQPAFSLGAAGPPVSSAGRPDRFAVDRFCTAWEVQQAFPLAVTVFSADPLPALDRAVRDELLAAAELLSWRGGVLTVWVEATHVLADRDLSRPAAPSGLMLFGGAAGVDLVTTPDTDMAEIFDEVNAGLLSDVRHSRMVAPDPVELLGLLRPAAVVILASGRLHLDPAELAGWGGDAPVMAWHPTGDAQASSLPVVTSLVELVAGLVGPAARSD